MKLVHYFYHSPQSRLGILLNESTVLDVNYLWANDFLVKGFKHFADRANYHCPPSLYEILRSKENPLLFLQETFEKYNVLKKSGDLKNYTTVSRQSTELDRPLDKIQTYRDFYSFEKHVKKGFEKRQEQMPEAWYEMPVYYKGSTANFIGPESEITWPSFTDKLDYELELGFIIARDGYSISEKKAYEHILGLTILNDVSARDIQRKEMTVRLGPSKGKDFCTVIGPVIVTMDEFNFQEPDLKMSARINGQTWSEGRSSDSHYSLAEMIAFASKDEWLLAADFMGTGTVGTGCGLELDKWIKSGDVVELEIEKIGILKNTVGKKIKN